MMHEQQSPARGERIHLKELAVYKYYRPLLRNDDKLVKSQVIDKYNESTVSNFSHLDLNSIMMYFMPAELNEEGIEVPPNLTLSDLDKAFITLNYPNKTPADKGMSVKDALKIAGVPEDVAKVIRDHVDATKYEEARNAFAKYNREAMKLKAVNHSFFQSVNPTIDVQSGIMDTMTKVINNPLFKSVVKNIINQVLVQRGIPTDTSIPGSAQSAVLDTIGALIMNPTFKEAVHDINTELTGLGKVNT